MNLEDKINREILRHAVGKQIKCLMSGKVLDVKSALMITLGMPSGRTAMQVYDMDEIGDHVENVILPHLRSLASQGKLTFEVLDGRELFGHKKVTK